MPWGFVRRRDVERWRGVERWWDVERWRGVERVRETVTAAAPLLGWFGDGFRSHSVLLSSTDTVERNCTLPCLDLYFKEKPKTGGVFLACVLTT